MNKLLPTSSMADQTIRNAEVEFFCKEIEMLYRKKKDLRVFEAGPGNGYLLSILKERFPKIKLFALEFSPELYQLILSRDLKGLKVKCGSICKENDIPEEWGKFDVIICERVIINILNRKDQYLACHNIAQRLLKKGYFIMSESFKEPLQNLNNARSDFSLTPIEESPHNDYLSEKFIEKWCAQEKLREISGQSRTHFLSTHFYLTRIIHEGLRHLGEKNNEIRPKFAHLLTFLEAAFPPAVGQFSPILFRVFQK